MQGGQRHIALILGNVGEVGETQSQHLPIQPLHHREEGEGAGLQGGSQVDHGIGGGIAVGLLPAVVASSHQARHFCLGVGARLVVDHCRHQPLHHDADVAAQRAGDVGETREVQAVVTWWAGRNTEIAIPK